MQARAKIVIILVIALIVSLVLVGRGGGTSGSTWFNLPSVTVNVQENGAAKVFGFNVNAAVLQPAMIQQLQAANIQKLEIRIGYNGIHVLANGEDMPYVEWDQAKTGNLQQVIRSVPGVPNSELIANMLPWLRKIGLGVALNLPVPQGTAKLSIPRWKGETAVRRTSPGEPTIGPIKIGSLVFDKDGQAIIEGIPASALAPLLGGAALPSLDANTLGILSALGAESFKIATHPNGINLLLNDKPLPGIAYDAASLGRLQALAGAFIADPATLDLVNKIVPLLPGADISAVVSFTGEAIEQTQLSAISVVVGADGTVESAAGVPLPAGVALPAAVVEGLGAANVQTLSVQVQPEGLAITANGRPLPAIAWNDASMQTLAKLIGPMAGISPDVIDQGMTMVRNLGIDVNLQLPAAEGAAAPAEPVQPVDVSGMTVPFIKLAASYGDQGFTEVGGLSAETLADLGVSLPALPPEVMSILKQQGVSQLQLKSGDGKLDVLLDGEMALAIGYDSESLTTALDLALPFLGDVAVLQDPVMMKFIREQILPLTPLAKIDVTLNLE